MVREQEPLTKRKLPSSRAGGQQPDHPAGGGAMDEHLVAIAGVQRRDAIRLSLDVEADMGDPAAVQHAVDRVLVVARSLR